jgi:hypothetical protein
MMELKNGQLIILLSWQSEKRLEDKRSILSQYSTNMQLECYKMDCPSTNKNVSNIPLHPRRRREGMRNKFRRLRWFSRTFLLLPLFDKGRNVCRRFFSLPGESSGPSFSYLSSSCFRRLRGHLPSFLLEKERGQFCRKVPSYSRE